MMTLVNSILMLKYHKSRSGFRQTSWRLTALPITLVMARTAMQVTLEVPEDLAPLLSEGSGGLTRAAMEALALEGLRSGKISVVQARRLLGIGSRYEMDGFLKAHEIYIPFTIEEIERDARAFRRE
jgi:uncharacterized protein UPF0175